MEQNVSGVTPWHEFKKKAWREQIKSITTDPNTYAGKFLANIEHMDEVPKQMSKNAEEFKHKAEKAAANMKKESEEFKDQAERRGEEMAKNAKGMVSKAKEWEASIWGPRKSKKEVTGTQGIFSKAMEAVTSKKPKET